MNYIMKSLEKLYRFLHDEIRVVKIPIEYLSLSALAGRVCYTDYPDFYDDKRLNDPQEMVKYLDRLSKWTHYSIFSHIPVEIEMNKDTFVKYELYNLFKAYYDEESETLKINLRHLLEAFNINNKGILSYVIFEFLGYEPHHIMPFRQILNEKARAIFNEDEGYFETIFIDLDDFNWMFFFIGNIDRVTTHQMVRHQTLNFNQQSHRYVKLDTLEVPRTVLSQISYDYLLIDEVYGLYDESLVNYNKLIKEYNVKPEVARIILPQGSPTNIVVSGYSSDIEKFIKDRLDSAAQGGIRTVAKDMKDLVDRYHQHTKIKERYILLTNSEGKQAIFDFIKKEIITDCYDKIHMVGVFKGMSNYVIVKNNDKEAILDITKNEIISDWFTEIKDLGLVRGESEYYIARLNGKEAIFHISGKQISDWWSYILDDGLIDGTSEFYKASNDPDNFKTFQKDDPSKPIDSK